MPKHAVTVHVMLGDGRPGEKIDGKRYSRRTTKLLESRDPDVLLAFRGSGLSSPDAILDLCESRACDWLEAAGLPHEAATRYWCPIAENGERSTWKALHAWPPPTTGQRVEVRDIDWIVAQAGYGRDERPDLAARMLHLCAELRHALLFSEPPEYGRADSYNRPVTVKARDDALRISFRLGALWVLGDVYLQDSASAGRAADAKYNQAGGYRQKKRQVLAAWASGKYKDKGACAEAESIRLGISFETARRYLKGAPSP